LANPLTGVYTVLLHNVLFDGTIFPENVTGRVELLKLFPRGPVNIATKSNQTTACNFTISTGRELKNIGFRTYWPRSQFPVEIKPANISKIDAMESAEFTVNIQISEDTLEGSYPTMFTIYAKEPVFDVTVLLNVQVDNTPPRVIVISPESGAVLGRTATIEVYANDPNGIETVKFEMETTSTIMTFDNATGHWTGSLDTTTLKDGVKIVKVTAVDKAGNAAEETTTITVDNTKPTVSIISPLDKAELSGNVTVTFTALDTNLKLAQLIIDKGIYDVTGKTSFTWDTTRVGDSAYTIKLVAYDKADNVAETSITVTTINVRLAIEATRNLYLAVGIPAGLIIGIVVTWEVLKRKLKPAPAPEPMPSTPS